MITGIFIFLSNHCFLPCVYNNDDDDKTKKVCCDLGSSTSTICQSLQAQVPRRVLGPVASLGVVRIARQRPRREGRPACVSDTRGCQMCTQQTLLQTSTNHSLFELNMPQSHAIRVSWLGNA